MKVNGKSGNTRLTDTGCGERGGRLNGGEIAGSGERLVPALWR